MERKGEVGAGGWGKMDRARKKEERERKRKQWIWKNQRETATKTEKIRRHTERARGVTKAQK